MAFHQKNPQRSPNQPLQSRSETPGLEAAHAPEAVERACLSPHPPMFGSLNEAPAAGIPGSPESPQSFFSSSVVTTDASSSKSGEESSSQEEVGSTSREVTLEALDERVSSLVDFLLVKYREKEPITKAEMLTIVSEEYQDHFADILLQASERMEMIFGLDVKEVDPIQHCYAIVIKLGLTYDGMLHGEKGVPKTGILILVLGAIFMKGNRATEEEVWKILNVVKLYPGKKHDIFGDPGCLITKHFVEEEYLKYQQVANSDPAQFEFLWGPRTHAETTKMQVLKYLAKIYGSDPSSFTSQYKEAFEEEQERSQGRVATAAIDYHGLS
ncbi:melanoma-associated antigen B16-like [Artibeus jamaicensis]|uniref:melanoma-associated antigen B16-like n=1 Tax=Artibeus jamaicensis TaxID=9417 RepID=UPI00187CDF19|nr:melanoma-associated antigen B16-like [Artibeus jamaicensis]XP_053511738.1 melanoma-associated antigen B16-like [Artibeus jamaicensis]